MASRSAVAASLARPARSSFKRQPLRITADTVRFLASPERAGEGATPSAAAGQREPRAARGMKEAAAESFPRRRAMGGARRGSATALYRAGARHSLRFTQGAGMTPPPMCATDGAPAGPGVPPCRAPPLSCARLSYPIGTLRRRLHRSPPLQRRPPPRRRSGSCRPPTTPHIRQLSYFAGYTTASTATERTESRPGAHLGVIRAG
jgi:hypothetical protein